MEGQRVAVVGIGATGAVLAAALLSGNPDTILVDPRTGLGDSLREKGITISGSISYQVPVEAFHESIGELKDGPPDIVFLCTKTFHLAKVVEELKGVVAPDTMIVSTHNGLGTEDVIGEAFGVDRAFRMSLNFGVSIKGEGEVEAAFFNPPNHLGALSAENRELGMQMAKTFTDSGLGTEFVDDIKLFVWKKMVMKCTMASICAVTDRTIKEALDFPPTREIADACFNEALAVAKAKGYDIGEDYMHQAVGYLAKVGVHRDSMCQDIANKTPTEIDFLGGKVVEYAREEGVATPYYIAMTNLVRAMEASYLDR
jgi:2-dehydropantoate 2-reductase